MALKLSLKPGEKFVINGAVVQNGDRRIDLVILNKVSILRNKDIMQLDEADTPVKRIYFAVMMMYMDKKSEKQFYQEFVERISEFMKAIKNEKALAECVSIIENVQAKRYYKALGSCKKLIPFEKQRLEYVST